jgi:hypothetical protein
MQGPVHPAGVEEHITRRRIASETGISRIWPMARCPQGPRREGEEPKPTMHGCGKSDDAIVAEKPANKAERSAAEPVERRAEAKGNAGQQRTLWTQSQDARVTGAGRMRTIAGRWSVRTRGGSRMRESRTYGSVRGAGSNPRPYRDRSETCQQRCRGDRP